MNRLDELIYNYEHIERSRVLDRAGALEQIEQEFQKKELQVKIWQKKYGEYAIPISKKFKYICDRITNISIIILLISLAISIGILFIGGSGLAYKYEINQRYERGLSEKIARQHILDQETCFKNKNIIKKSKERVNGKQIDTIFVERELDSHILRSSEFVEE